MSRVGLEQSHPVVCHYQVSLIKCQIHTQYSISGLQLGNLTPEAARSWKSSPHALDGVFSQFSEIDHASPRYQAKTLGIMLDFFFHLLPHLDSFHSRCQLFHRRISNLSTFFWLSLLSPKYPSSRHQPPPACHSVIPTNFNPSKFCYLEPFLCPVKCQQTTPFLKSFDGFAGLLA